ncbi:MAG: hypothetical protein GX946_09555 [Oligosphaeraceae bacterium]|nr:hypothetical protein [Oligosphaeraceae bacterium]
MQDWTVKLLALQEIDLQLTKINGQLAQVPLKQEEAEALYQNENQACEKTRQQVKEGEVALRQLDNEITMLQNKKRDFQSKTALIKNNDEYRAALLHIESCDHSIKTLEDQQLEKMLELDQLKEQYEQDKKDMEQAKARAEIVKQEYATLAENCREQIDILTAEAEKAAAEIEPELLSRYRQLRSGRNRNSGRPCVVPLIDGSCGRCRMRMTPQTCQDTANGKVVSCPECAAILYSE